MASFFTQHFDALITIIITIVGFFINYYFTNKNLKNEIIKSKKSLTAETIKTLPFDILSLMDDMMDSNNNDDVLKKYKSILSRILAYCSKDAVNIAILLQQNAYSDPDRTKHENLTALSLLITQIKYDITSEIISPESWFQMRIKDYNSRRQETVSSINSLINRLKLNKKFCCHI